MTLLNTAKAVYTGPTAAKAIYVGDKKVWPPAPTGPSYAINDPLIRTRGIAESFAAPTQDPLGFWYRAVGAKPGMGVGDRASGFWHPNFGFEITSDITVRFEAGWTRAGNNAGDGATLWAMLMREDYLTEWDRAYGPWSEIAVGARFLNPGGSYAPQTASQVFDNGVNIAADRPWPIPGVNDGAVQYAPITMRWKAATKEFSLTNETTGVKAFRVATEPRPSARYVPIFVAAVGSAHSLLFHVRGTVSMEGTLR